MLSETVELRGHIIDSLILPKVLDEILTRGANFKIAQVKIGQKRTDQSFARIEVSAESSEALDDLILRLRQHGAEVAEKGDAQLAPAPSDGIFPADFYVTTNQQTFVRIGGREFEVRAPMLDSAIMFDRQQEIARTVRFADVRKGMEIVVGHKGVRVAPRQRATSRRDIFQFLNANISAERPKGALIREIAREFEATRKAKGKILIVAGAAVVHTGAAEYLERMIKGVTLALLMGTMLHSVAAANLLPASVKTLVVDINPAAVAKLTDDQTFQALGLVTDIEPFLRELTECLSQLRGVAKTSRT